VEVKIEDSEDRESSEDVSCKDKAREREGVEILGGVFDRFVE
jgi:hypothetical protein